MNNLIEFGNIYWGKCRKNEFHPIVILGECDGDFKACTSGVRSGEVRGIQKRIIPIMFPDAFYRHCITPFLVGSVFLHTPAENRLSA